MSDSSFDQYWEQVGDRWGATVDRFVDPGFGENAEILSAMEERLGLDGIDRFLDALNADDLREAQRFCDLITEQERRASKGDCHNRLLARRGLSGAIVIVIDQPGNPDYVPPLVATKQVQRFTAPRRRRYGARLRSIRGGKPLRRRGSRRGPAAITGPSPDDPEPEPRPALGGHRLQAPPRARRVVL